MNKGLLDIEALHKSDITALLDRAAYFQPIQRQKGKRLDLLQDRLIVNLFLRHLRGRASALRLPPSGWARMPSAFRRRVPAFPRAKLCWTP